MKTTVVCLGLLLIWAAPVSVSLASDVKFQASLVVSNQPRQDIKVYFNYSTPAIDGQDIYYIADYARNLYRYRNGTSSIIVSNFDARAPQITGFNDVHADQGVVLFAASKVAYYAPGAHPIDAYYSLANGQFHRLIGIGDTVPGTTNVVIDIGLPKIFRGLPYLYCAHTGGVGTIVRFDQGVGTNLCFTGNAPVGGGPMIKRILNFSVTAPDTIEIMTLGDFPPGLADPVLLQYRSIHGEIRFTRTLAFPGDKGSYPVINGLAVDGDELGILINGTAAARTTIYRYSAGVLNRVFSWTIDSGETINGVHVGVINSITMHRGNLVIKMNSETNGVLYGFLPRGHSGTPIATSLDPKIFGLDVTPWGLNIDQNSFTVETEKGMVRVDMVVPEADINAADFDGDGIADLSLFEDEIATWFNLYSSNGFNTVGFGYDGITAVPMDYDGDGKADISVFDPNSGVWNRYLTGEKKLLTDQFGFPGVKPVMADYDGDGLADIAVYDESNGLWYIFSTTKGFSVTQFGYPGTEAVPHDFDGDQITDLAVYDRSNGMWYRYGSRSGFRMDQFGYPGAAPKPADFDGDGKADICVFDNNNGTWFLFGSSSGFKAASFGYIGVEAVPANIDGDNKADLTVFDPRISKWYYFGSQTGYGDRQY